MSLKDKSSIVITRGSASKSGSLAGWNPQTNEIVSLSVTQNTSNLSRVNESGLIEFVSSSLLPRDFVNGGCGEFNIWPERTNNLINSEDFSSYLTSGTITLTANYGTSPDGTTNSTRVQFSGADESLYIGATHSANDEGNAIYIKGTSGETITFGRGANVAQGTLKTLTGDWQRVEEFSSAGGVYVAASTYNSATARDIEIWGAEIQTESGVDVSYMTSYIKTTGSTATRNRIELSGATLDALIGQGEGGIYGEIKVFDNSVTNTLSINDNNGNDSTNKRVELRLSSQVTFDVVNSGTTSCSIAAGTVSTDTYTKVLGRYSVNDFSLHQDGSTIGSDSSGGTFSSGDLTDIKFKAAGGVPEIFYGAIRNLVVFNYAPTQVQANELTT